MDDATLTKLICAHLGQLDGWHWSESDDDPPTDKVGIFYGAIGTAPDRAVGVRVYGRTDSRPDFLTWRRVQLRVRGERGRVDGADVLADVASAQMEELYRVAGISDVSFQSMSPAGPDGSRREERTENYIIILDNQESI